MDRTSLERPQFSTGGCCRALAVALLVLGCLAPARVWAQWSERPTLISLPAPEERWGISVGSFRIQPRLGLEGRYDTNLFRQDSEEAPTSAGILRLMPGVTVANSGRGVLGLRLDLGGDARFYFGDDGRIGEQRNAGVISDLDVVLFPQGGFRLRVFDRFRRALETRNLNGGNYNRNFNLAGTQLLLRPGGGALEFGLEYAYAFDFFDEFSAGDLRYHDLGFHAMWKFYPLTAVFLEADYKVIAYDEPFVDRDSGVGNVDSQPLRVVVGLQGYLTRWLALLVQAGWAEGFYEDGPSFGGVIGLARLSFKPTVSTLLQVGYGRDYEDSLYANYYAEHRVFVSAQQRFFGWLGVSGSLSWHRADYARFVPSGELYTVNEAERKDDVLVAEAGVKLDVSRWFGLNLGYRFDSLLSDFEIGRVGLRPDVPTYGRHLVWANLEARY